MGQAHQRAGRLRDAEYVYRQILAVHPCHAGALEYLGVLETSAGHAERAVGLLRLAVHHAPRAPTAHFHLGNALKRAGQVVQAIAAYDAAIALRPGFLEAWNNRGNAQRSIDRLPDAVASFEQAVAVAPNAFEPLNNLALALLDCGRRDEAFPVLQRVIAIKPEKSISHFQLGTLYAERGQPDLAVDSYRRAIAADPGFGEAYGNLANELRNMGRHRESMPFFRKAVELLPASAEAHANLAVELLTEGDFTRGWEENEWRWKCKDFPSPQRNFSQPQWDGSPLNSAQLLIHTEQGLGDSIQFIRYLPMIFARAGLTEYTRSNAGRIILECDSPLAELFQSIAPCSTAGVSIFRRGQPLPSFDLHCPLLSLPRIFQTRLQTIPANVPYLVPKPAEIDHWRQRLESFGSQLKVGLAWAGSPLYKNDRTRSIRLEQFAPLAQMAGVHFFSLQKGPASEQLRTPPPGLRITDWSEEFGDLNQAAALIANLDVVLTVDTATAHLAGALARPTWVLLPQPADWRWLLSRDDSPWYPTMRLFRQASPGDWSSVLQAVVAVLRKKVGERYPNPVIAAGSTGQSA